MRAAAPAGPALPQSNPEDGGRKNGSELAERMAKFLNVFEWIAQGVLKPLFTSRRFRQLRAMAFVAPIADVALSFAQRNANDPSAFKLKLDMATMPLLSSAIASFVKFYLLLLFLRVLLTWFPNFDWVSQPWNTLRQVTDPYLNIFRGIIPPLLGQIDFTPILGFIVLQFLSQVLDVQGGTNAADFPNMSQFPDDEAQWAEDIDVDDILADEAWEKASDARQAEYDRLEVERPVL